ncbi:ATPase [Fulvivirgaceae bacterium PWU5]|uniref:ATPase n=1 Tax=Dawidia cretensis TaxID=2782350 RepID=A0AAP2E052_9BACT|nr:ATPase [Dawidia cretensis]
MAGYDFTWLTLQLEKYGKQNFGDHFHIHQENHDIIRRLLVYFLEDVPQARHLGIDLTKGILLTGPIGCGKTDLMTLMRLAAKPERIFTIKTIRDVSFEFIQEGYEVVHRYSKLSFNPKGPRTVFFDDLGAEQALKYYGNECNVMAEILLSRYDLYISFDMLTHLTTNLSATEIETMYGPRVRSRMREMFNLIPFNESSDDRRI